MVIEPALGGSSAEIMRRSVVLPQPDGPTNATNSPSATSRSTPATARKTPPPAALYSLATLFNSMAFRAPATVFSACLRSIPSWTATITHLSSFDGRIQRYPSSPHLRQGRTESQTHDRRLWREGAPGRRSVHRLESLAARRAARTWGLEADSVTGKQRRGTRFPRRGPARTARRAATCGGAKAGRTSVDFRAHPGHLVSEGAASVERDPLPDDRSRRRRSIGHRAPGQVHPLRRQHTRQNLFIAFGSRDAEEEVVQRRRMRRRRQVDLVLPSGLPCGRRRTRRTAPDRSPARRGRWRDVGARERTGAFATAYPSADAAQSTKPYSILR